MSRTVIVVLDGFGIGAMPDAGTLRPGDLTADTLAHTLDHCREARGGNPLRLPALRALGLGLLHPHPDLGRVQPVSRGPQPDAPAPPPGVAPSAAAAGPELLPVTVTRAPLGYPGADTYAGHQTMMGADFSAVTVARLAEHLPAVTEALTSAGHTVRTLDGEPLLVVDGHVLVHDNLEADPGINWNATGRLEDLPFSGILRVARTVRAVAPVARVIAVGGHAPDSLTGHVRHGDGGTFGLDTPATGFYRHDGLAVQHLGAPLDHTRQLPELAARAGLPVTLTGKAADILACEDAVRRPAVPTAEVFTHTLAAVRAAGRGQRALVVANVQETDLAGHQQDADLYGTVLERADQGLGELIDALDSPGDTLIVTGDHGNDPTSGHAYHTREYVPVLLHRQGASGARRLPDAAGLADVGATAARTLGLDPATLANGTPLGCSPPH
ncbi:phosphopentomutase [Streptomyces sp. N2-109]|uniref:Phosphopentomutase n=1 Tax=Streptomyces gossypii TaxID=2883101 RepID=A0ABT2JR10_9ACTN|nr:phosphopentomutase [Streptomyces gossypii]MCT2590318.1 phosphopentomutase [Streptomyces gossypii]